MNSDVEWFAVWHEENDAGVPTHVMGASPAFDTKDGAMRWVQKAVEEDRGRHEESGRSDSDAFDDETEDDVRHTYGNGQHTYYRVVGTPTRSLESESEKELVGLVEKIDRATRTADSCYDAVEKVQALVNKWYKETGRPALRRWTVDVRCMPSFSVSQNARTAEEAEELVNKRIDDGTLCLDDAQWDDVRTQLLNSVETVEAIGEAGEV